MKQTHINCYKDYTNVSNYESVGNRPFNMQLIKAVLSWYTLFTNNICQTVTVFQIFLHKQHSKVPQGCMQLWIRSTEQPGEHRYENVNIKVPFGRFIYCTVHPLGIRC